GSKMEFRLPRESGPHAMSAFAQPGLLLAAQGARETRKLLAIKSRLKCTRCGGQYADLQPDWSQLATGPVARLGENLRPEIPEGRSTQGDLPVFQCPVPILRRTTRRCSCTTRLERTRC